MNKIKTLSVDWMERWANRPRWIVSFDSPHSEAYREVGDGLLLSIVGERADFFAYTGPGTGFGGRSFTITMADGSTRVLIGPWSSNSGEVNARVPESEHVAEATDDGCMGAVTAAGIARYIDEHPECGFGLAQVTWGDSIWYEPTRNGAIKPDGLSPVTVLKVLR
jgi:hypothetical protein